MEKNRVFIEKNCVYGTFLEATLLSGLRSHFVGGSKRGGFTLLKMHLLAF